jgi:hypothetical protein
MTPFESSLLEASWPFLSSAIGLVAVWYLKTLAKTMEGLAESMASMKDHVAQVEGEIKTDLLEYKRESQHRVDQLIGRTDSRLGKIETVCSMQHGVTFRRRSTDVDPDWSQNSDISGSSAK